MTGCAGTSNPGYTPLPSTYLLKKKTNFTDSIDWFKNNKNESIIHNVLILINLKISHNHITTSRTSFFKKPTHFYVLIIPGSKHVKASRVTEISHGTMVVIRVYIPGTFSVPHPSPKEIIPEK